jgi:hypothetical protein
LQKSSIATQLLSDNIKILFSGHGKKGFIGRRTAANIVDYVVTLRGVLPTQSSIDTVAMKGCNPGADFGRDDFNIGATYPCFE